MRKEFNYYGNNILVVSSEEHLLVRAEIPVSLQEISHILRKECALSAPVQPNTPSYKNRELHVGNVNVARKSRFFELEPEEARAVAWAFEY